MDPALTIAGTDDRQVDGEEDRGEAERRPPRAISSSVTAVIAEDVDLEEADAVRCCGGDLRRARGREGREAHRGSRRPRRRAPSPPRRPGAPAAGRRRARRRPALATGRPSTVVAVVTSSIPQSTRWRSRHDANASTLSASVRSRPGSADEVLGPVGVEARDGERLDVGQRQRRLHRRHNAYNG